MDDSDQAIRSIRGRVAARFRSLFRADRIASQGEATMKDTKGTEKIEFFVLKTKTNSFFFVPFVSFVVAFFYYRIASLKLTPARNPGIFRAFTFSVLPVKTLL